MSRAKAGKRRGASPSAGASACISTLSATRKLSPPPNSLGFSSSFITQADRVKRWPLVSELNLQGLRRGWQG